ncbi:radical SAM protein [bacterium]|nr:radical SAM protein [candidate division CSSED10-310 bacterium]
MTAGSIPLDWVDAFIHRIRPYIRVRSEDNLLIRMPNECFKLNRTGTRIMAHLLAGGGIDDILTARADDPEARRQVATFLTDITLLLGAGFCDAYHSPAVERVPFELGYIELPILSEVALTYRCNIRCRFCYAACRQEAAPAEEELTTDQVKTLLRIIRHDAGVPSVSFTGGEPTLRRDLEELVAFASGEMGMRVNLITNGTRLDATTAERLAAAGLASAQVSIEAPDAVLHDRITGLTGAWEASVEGLRNLRAAGILVHPHTTLNALNQAVAPVMARFAGDLGIDRFSANLVIPTGRGRDPDLDLSYSALPALLAEIMAAAAQMKTRFMWYSPTPVCIFNPVAHGLGNKGCSACEGLLAVDPAGNLLPCSSWTAPVGSLLHTGFRELWFGARATFLRDKRAALGACRQCAHFALCHGACPLYFQVHGHAELEPYLPRIMERSGT